MLQADQGQAARYTAALRPSHCPASRNAGMTVVEVIISLPLHDRIREVPVSAATGGRQPVEVFWGKSAAFAV